MLTMCGPKKQTQTSRPNLKLMSSLPAPELWVQRAHGQGEYSILHCPQMMVDKGQALEGCAVYERPKLLLPKSLCKLLSPK